MSILSQLFLPEICCICGEIADDGVFFDSGKGKIKSPFCAACTARLEKSFRCTEKQIQGISAHAVYLFSFNDETTERAIYHIKTIGCSRSIGFFAELAKLVLKEFIKEKGVCITNVPRSISLLEKFGFDQSERVTRTLVRASDNFRYKKLFERDKRFKKSQRLMGERERLTNARKSLKLFDRNTPEKVIVIDDMITTGATAIATYELLTSAGCGKIYFLFLAGKEKTKERRTQNE